MFNPLVDHWLCSVSNLGAPKKFKASKNPGNCRKNNVLNQTNKLGKRSSSLTENLCFWCRITFTQVLQPASVWFACVDDNAPRLRPKACAPQPRKIVFPREHCDDDGLLNHLMNIDEYCKILLSFPSQRMEKNATVTKPRTR